MADFISILKTYAFEFMGTDIRFHPVYLLPFFLIALGVYLYERKTLRQDKSFWAWLFPRVVYFHPSHWVDLKLFLIGRLLLVSKVFNLVVVQTAMAVVGMGLIALATGMEMTQQPVTPLRIFLATVIITIVSDFCVYWVHRFHHQTPIFWPFHAVHHSAEVMSPLTVYRKHPLYDLLSDVLKALLIGLAQGMILMLILGKVQLSLIVGLNMFYFLFNALGSNFRHSHIWIRYGNFLEHIFISPAQHQVHHSLNPKHHNKNYGEIFALWDWLFGTLYIPQGRETLFYGISKSSSSDERIPQPHNTLSQALWGPFRESWRVIKRAHKASNASKVQGKK